MLMVKEAFIRWWQGMYRKALEAEEGAVEAGNPAGDYEGSLHTPCPGGPGIDLHSHEHGLATVAPSEALS